MRKGIMNKRIARDFAQAAQRAAEAAPAAQVQRQLLQQKINAIKPAPAPQVLARL